MKVGIVMGSGSDRPIMQKAADMLDRFGIEYTMQVLSAHKTPDEAIAFGRSAKDNGYGVIICGAGKAAHLAGAAAAHSTLPIIGVPIAAGGLGVLAGDHAKSASDLGIGL